MKTELEAEWARIIPQGSINITNAEKLRDEFTEIMNQGVNKIILDLKNVDDLDSAALGKILVANSALAEKGGKLIIENVESESVQKVLATVNLSDMIEIRD